MMNTPTIPINVTDIEDTAAAEWLAEMLEPARRRVLEAPTAEAVARMRARIFAETGKRSGKIAA